MNLFTRAKRFTARGFASFRITMLEMARTQAVEAYHLAYSKEETDRALAVIEDINARIALIQRCMP